MQLRGFSEWLQVIGVRSQEEVPVTRKQHERGIDHVLRPTHLASKAPGRRPGEESRATILRAGRRRARLACLAPRCQTCPITPPCGIGGRAARNSCLISANVWRSFRSTALRARASSNRLIASSVAASSPSASVVIRCGM